MKKELFLIKEIKYKAIEYSEKNNIEDEDAAYFMTLMDDAFKLGYNLGWKGKAAQMTKDIKDYFPNL